ncbi:hypothetical protein GCM10023176_34920 [Micromonospora coerulea]|uniref:Uncharacterized protein n=1 Tax=Micromonospora coerulea TaxID=47856 RepID=A0ABP8SQN8_9ACTN
MIHSSRRASGSGIVGKLSWLHCVASEVEARAGAGAASHHQIDLAATAIEANPTPPKWLDFYDAGRLHSFAGYAALAADDHTEATRQLTEALAGLTSTAAKQRSVILADLAAAHRQGQRCVRTAVALGELRRG